MKTLKTISRRLCAVSIIGSSVVPIGVLGVETGVYLSIPLVILTLLNLAFIGWAKA